MTHNSNPWHEARLLQATLAALGVEEGEIAFPAASVPCAGAICFVSENLTESPELTPSMAAELHATIQRVHRALQGFSVLLKEGSLSLLEGDSGGFLAAWAQCPVLREENYEEVCARC